MKFWTREEKMEKKREKRLGRINSYTMRKLLSSQMALELRLIKT